MCMSHSVCCFCGNAEHIERSSHLVSFEVQAHWVVSYLRSKLRSCLTLKLCPSLRLTSFPAFIIPQDAFSITTTHITLTDFKMCEICFIFPLPMVHIFYFFRFCPQVFFHLEIKVPKRRKYICSFFKMWFNFVFSLIHHVLSGTFLPFYHILNQFSLAANTLPSFLFTAFTWQHLWLTSPPNKTHLFTIKCSAAIFESIYVIPFLSPAIWLNEDKRWKLK